jgi:hypothetical protein
MIRLVRLVSGERGRKRVDAQTSSPACPSTLLSPSPFHPSFLHQQKKLHPQTLPLPLLRLPPPLPRPLPSRRSSVSGLDRSGRRARERRVERGIGSRVRRGRDARSGRRKLSWRRRWSERMGRGWLRVGGKGKEGRERIGRRRSRFFDLRERDERRRNWRTRRRCPWSTRWRRVKVRRQYVASSPRRRHRPRFLRRLFFAFTVFLLLS